MSVTWGGCFYTLLLILTGLGSVWAEISDLRRCADPECKEPISKGRTIIGYPSNDEHILSFPINAEVTVFSKEAGSRDDLWGVEIKGKRGYAPKTYIREQKVFKSKLDYEVPTEAVQQKIAQEEAKEDSVNENPKEGNEGEEVSHSTAEEIALSAEDVEYKRLQEAALKETTKDPHKEGVEVIYEEKNQQKSIEQQSNDENSSPNQKAEPEEYEEEEEEEKEEEEEEEDEDVEPVEEQEYEMNDDNVGDPSTHEAELESANEKSDGIISDDKDIPKDDVGIDSQENQKHDEVEVKADEDNKEKDSIMDVETTTSSVEASPAPEESLASDEVSPVDYEVIDGTTLYFDDATPMPPASEVVSPVNLLPSSVVDDAYVTAHPSPLPESEGELLDHTKDIHATSTQNLETSATVSVESGSVNPVTEVPIKPTEALPDGLEVTKSVLDIEDKEHHLEPSSSWLSEATATVTSWFGSEDKEKGTGDSALSGESDTPPGNEGDADEDSGDDDDFGDPKAESVLDGAESMEKNEESKGFFSNWFGSSEELKEENEEKPAEASEDLGNITEDGAVNEENELVSEKDSKDMSAETSETDPVDASVPTDNTETPIEPSDASATNVDPVYITEHSTLSPVDDIPKPPAMPIPDESSEIPVEPDEIIPKKDPSVDPSSQPTSDRVDPSDDSDDDEEPSTSTARPLYAEPDPAYHPHSQVDPEDLSYIAGESAIMDGAESTESEAGDMSLSEGLLKTSHNLWLTISGALQLPEGLAFGFEAEVAEPHVSNGMLVFLLIVAGTVITIYFVHLVMLKLSREAPLLEALNRIDHENRVKGDENESLHTELIKAREELKLVSSRVTSSSGDVDEISSQLEMVKKEYASEKSHLEERVVQLEHELEEATTNGLEMHKMLSEMLSAQKESSAFQASIDHLQSMLDGQREKVETLTSDLALKNRLNEELHSELSASMERANKLDYQVEQLTHSLEELTGVKGEAIRKLQEEAAMVEELKQANTSLSQQTGEYDSKVVTLTEELNELRDTINQLRESVETKESELQVAKECLKQLRLTSTDDSATPDEEKLSALFDVIRVKAELQKVNNERLTLVEQLQDAEMAQRNLEDTMLSIRTEVTELKTHHDVAIREKLEALSKLEVLTKYFEEKEAQLNKELESQEGMRLSAEGSAAAVARKIQNYELELASAKTQVETLRKELEEQEASYKTQISSHEQKAHENWLQARAAERKHEEQRQENSQLRSRLALLQKEKDEVQQSQVNIIKPTPKRVDANGTVSSPRPMVDGVDGDHSGPPSLHRDLDSPPIPPPPHMHGHPMLPMMFPPGAPLPPGVPPPHGLPGVPPPPPGLPHGVPPPHGLPPHPFLPGEHPFMGPLPPLPGDRRLPPAGGMSSPPFRRSGSPSYDRNDRYSPLSDRSHVSDRRYSPPPLRRRPLSPEMHRRSPDRRSDRTRSPDRRSDRMMRSPDHRNDRRSPDRRSDRRSPDRHYTRSPDGYTRQRSSPRNYYDEPDFSNDDPRLRSHIKGKKTSTPIGPNDR